MIDIKQIDELFPNSLFLIKETETGRILYPTDNVTIKFIENLEEIELNEFFDRKTNKYYSMSSAKTEDGFDIYKYEDITDLKLKIKQLEIDLTLRIPIKRKLYEDLKKFLKSYDSTPAPFTIAIVDIDNFKRINDTYGHIFGDKILLDIAQFLNQNTRHITDETKRPHDGIYRFGGEEIILIIKGINIEDSKKRLEQIREKQASKNYHFSGKHNSGDEQITFSIGAVNVTKVPELKKEEVDAFIEDCINEADYNLYMAKQEGKNKVKVNEK